MEIQAYGKLNLTLDVIGQDARGYHLLSSVFSEISLADTVVLEPGGTGITMVCNLPYIPTDQRNLCRKAADAFFELLPLAERNFRIELTKRIPVCAGLGGGSSDAAAVLKLLCSYFHISPDCPEVRAAAARVGADVSFFLTGGVSLAEGIGDVLTPLPSLPNYGILVAKTQENASTPHVYREYDLRKDAFPMATPGFLSALRAGDDIAPFVSNHLTQAASALCPSVIRLKSQMRSAGALCAEMTGSGSAVFGLFPNEAAAQEAKKQIDAQFCEVCRFVSR